MLTKQQLEDPPHSFISGNFRDKQKSKKPSLKTGIHLYFHIFICINYTINEKKKQLIREIALGVGEEDDGCIFSQLHFLFANIPAS